MCLFCVISVANSYNTHMLTTRQRLLEGALFCHTIVFLGSTHLTITVNSVVLLERRLRTLELELHHSMFCVTEMKETIELRSSNSVLNQNKQRNLKNGPVRIS